MTAWTTTGDVQAALGPTVPFITDPVAPVVVDAANAWAFRKRAQAGYDDPPEPDAPAPAPDVAFGTTLYAVALWRERASTDSFPSFEDLAAYQPGPSTLGQIRRLLGVGRAATDTPLGELAATAVTRRRARRRWLV